MKKPIANEHVLIASGLACFDYHACICRHLSPNTIAANLCSLFCGPKLLNLANCRLSTADDTSQHRQQARAILEFSELSLQYFPVYTLTHSVYIDYRVSSFGHLYPCYIQHTCMTIHNSIIYPQRLCTLVHSLYGTWCCTCNEV